MGDKCYVCGVNDNVEEISGDEDEGVVTGALDDIWRPRRAKRW